MTPEEKAERRTYICSTDTPRIMGIAPSSWGGKFSVYMEKVEGWEQPDNPLLSAGRKIEPYIAEMYAERMDVTVEKKGFSTSRHFPWMASSYDYVAGVGPKSDNFGPTLLEIKNVSHFASGEWGDDGTDEVTDHYALQVQHQMLVSGIYQADIAALIGGAELRVYHLEADREIQDAIVSATKAFWETHIAPKVPPDLDGSTGCQTFLKNRYPKNNGTLVMAADDTRHAVMMLREMKGRQQELDRVVSYWESQIKDAIGENDGIVLPDGEKITWRKAKDRQVVDWEAVASRIHDDLPESEAGITPLDAYCRPFTKTVPGSRTFLTPRSWKGE